MLMLMATMTIGLGSCHQRAEAQDPPVYTYRIINTFPHRTQAFTQGLVFADGFLYEGTGGKGTSHLSKIDLKTGKVLQQVSLPDHFWGEGITLFADRIYQLTWKGQLGYTFARGTLKPGPRFKYQGEGWGLTHNSTHLIMSDGSHRLYFRDPNSFAVVRTLNIHDRNRAVSRLNELEYVKDRIYANIWMTAQIAVIDPNSGQVTAWIDLAGLKARHRNADVLNGIAYDAAGDRLFVTGKWWSKLYEIALVASDRTLDENHSRR